LFRLNSPPFDQECEPKKTWSRQSWTKVKVWNTIWKTLKCHYVKTWHWGLSTRLIIYAILVELDLSFMSILLTYLIYNYIGLVINAMFWYNMHHNKCQIKKKMIWQKIIKKTPFLWKFEKTCSTCKRFKSLGIGTMTGYHATIYMKEIIDYWVTNYWEFNNQIVTPKIMQWFHLIRQVQTKLWKMTMPCIMFNFGAKW